MNMPTNQNELREKNIKLYDFIFNHEHFYHMRLTSKYLFCVMMDYRDLSNDCSISIPQDLLAKRLHSTIRSITTMKKELKNHNLIEETFIGIGEVTKISINDNKVNQYKNQKDLLTFNPLPKDIYDNEEMSIASKVLFAYLMNQVKENDTEGISLSNDEIKNMLNVSLSKARKTKKELVELGKITEKRRGYAQANTIFINKQ